MLKCMNKRNEIDNSVNSNDLLAEERRKMISRSGTWFIIVTLTLAFFVLFYSGFLDDSNNVAVRNYSKYFAYAYIFFITSLWFIRTLNPDYLGERWERNASILIFVNGMIWGGVIFCYAIEGRALASIFLCIIILFCSVVSGYTLKLVIAHCIPMFISLLISEFIMNGLPQMLSMFIILLGIWFVIKTSNSLINQRICREIATLVTLERKAYNAYHYAKTDYLTEVYNRRGFEIEFKKVVSRCVLKEESFAVILIDIDFFKKINDTFGHVIGDECLIKVATILKDCTKNFITSIARYGGDEFIILISNATLLDINIICNNVMKSINISKLSTVDEGSISVTQGAAFCDKKKSTINIIEVADKALFEAKNSGRNCYRVVQQ